ncbi:hypothetical protein Y032_0006g2938 [Ancylostoma ceylanicum]|uniref:Uncharacterized protein n=1 Tax=Ancylostoma ceylanicum TaxID=53326 RepID=A0A016VRF0_9BILA|nr:hypothetical protein Y032_0006g2938 [Ancylostoma ceylanicum]
MKSRYETVHLENCDVNEKDMMRLRGAFKNVNYVCLRANQLRTPLSENRLATVECTVVTSTEPKLFHLRHIQFDQHFGDSFPSFLSTMCPRLYQLNYEPAFQHQYEVENPPLDVSIGRHYFAGSFLLFSQLSAFSPRMLAAMKLSKNADGDEVVTPSKALDKDHCPEALGHVIF